MLSQKPRKKPQNKRCKDGYPCKRSCISRAKNCRKPLKWQAKTFALWLKLQEERLAVTNQKRSKAGLTPATMNDQYITADRTKLPQSARVEKAIAPLKELAKLRIDSEPNDTGESDDAAIKPDTISTPRSQSDWDKYNEMTEKSLQRTRDTYAQIPSTRVAAAKYIGVDPSEIKRNGNYYYMSIPPEKRNDTATKIDRRGVKGKTIKQVILDYMRYTDPSWNSSHDLFQAGMEDRKGNPTKYTEKAPLQTQTIPSSRSATIQRKEPTSAKEKQPVIPKEINIDGVNYSVVEYIPTSRDDAPNIYNRGVRGTLAIKSPRSSKTWQVYQFEDGRYSGKVSL